MSATDRIRARIDSNRYVVSGAVGVSAPVPLTVEEVEALCDMADAVRDHQKTPSYTVNCDCFDCRAYRVKIMDARRRMAAALSRLDGEDDQ